jgi:phosphonate C-P lyase system protein PhnG
MTRKCAAGAAFGACFGQWRGTSGLWARLGIDPACEMVRGPETGLVALRGRIGGGGAPFNFGEATVTRATVRLENGAVGHSVALGRDRRKAKLIAILDALAQDPEMETKIDAEIVRPLKAFDGGSRRKAPRRNGGDQGRFLHDGARRRLMAASEQIVEGGFADPVFAAQSVFAPSWTRWRGPAPFTASSGCRAAGTAQRGCRGRGADIGRRGHAGLARAGFGAQRRGERLAFLPHRRAVRRDAVGCHLRDHLQSGDRAAAFRFRARHAGISGPLDDADPAGGNADGRTGADARGPGIKKTQTIAPRPLPGHFEMQWRENNALYPRGIDIILAAPDAVACLPRTTRIANGEA